MHMCIHTYMPVDAHKDVYQVIRISYGDECKSRLKNPKECPKKFMGTLRCHISLVSLVYF